MAKKEFKKGIGYVPQWYVDFPASDINRYFDKGIPSGCIMQIQGDGEGTFKTTLALQIASNVQKLGYDIAYVDAENAVFMDVDEEGSQTNNWFENIGVSLEQTYIIPQKGMEELYEDIKILIKDYGVKFIVLDSIHAMQPTKVHEQDAGESVIGLHAKIHGIELVRLSGLLREHDATLCAINHKKDVITNQGSMGKRAIGGKGWGFYSQIIIVTKRTTSKYILDDKDLIPLEIYLEKNKFGESFKTVKTEVKQGFGVIPEYELLKKLMLEGRVTKSGKGGWYSLDDETIGQGTENAVQWLKENYE